jgi:hypothetical protein
VAVAGIVSGVLRAALMLAAATASGESGPWTASFTPAVVLHLGSQHEVSFTGSFEVGFEPARFLRLFNFGTAVRPPLGGRVRGDVLRVLLGLEGILSPLLPLELAAGAAAGLTTFDVCGGDCLGYASATVQLRLFAGFRPCRWLTIGLLASWNSLVSPVPTPAWLEAGARAAVRW